MHYDDLNPDENRLDQTLRDKFEAFELPPAPPVWAGIEARLGDGPPPPGRGRPVPLPLLFLLTALVSGLGGWLLPGVADRTPPTPRLHQPLQARNVPAASGVAPTTSGKVSTMSETALATPDAAPVTSETVVVTSETVSAASGTAPTMAETVAATSGTAPTMAGTVAATSGTAPTMRSEVPTKRRNLTVLAGVAIGADEAPATRASQATPAVLLQIKAATDSTPAVLRPLLALETTYQTQPKPTLADPATADRAAVLATLRAERTELLRLQRRTDSLLLALGEGPAAPPLATDTAQQETRNQPQETRKWSLLLSAAPEQNYLGFDAPGRDELTNLRRNQETGRGGFNAALLGEYQATKRLSVGGGVGYSRYGAELRQAVRNTTYDVRYSTTTTTDTVDYTSIIKTYSVRIVQIPQLNPVFNAGGQVLRYDTVYVPRNDTLRTTLVSHDTVRTVRTTVTPLLQPTTTTTYKTYRPDYRFLTLPLMVRYRFSPAANTRLWADVAAGAQFQFFLGGTQLVSNDGQTFHTETVGAGEGPFRQLNVALNASLALNYALSNRLSVSVGPSLRWQALSVFKAETGLRQTPTATGLQVGMRWKL